MEFYQVSSVCSKEKYPYGFNGQMKVNEWAGVGNHTTALWWEYDTRTARRYNVDPKLDYSLSPYSTFRSSPLMYSDPNGDIALADNAITGIIGGVSGLTFGLWKEVHNGGWKALRTGKAWAHIGVATAQGTIIGVTQGASLLVSTSVAAGATAVSSLADDAIDQKPLNKKAFESAALKGAFAAGGNVIFNRFGLANDQITPPYKYFIGAEVTGLNGLVSKGTDKWVDGWQEGYIDPKDGAARVKYHRGVFEGKKSNTKSHDMKGDRKQNRIEKRNEREARKAWAN
jgi:hypothetical protein